MKKLVVHVSASGGGQGDGTPDNPLRTLTDARDFIRAHRKEADSFEVVVGPGVYTVNEPLMLDERDSGTKDAPIVWRAEQPGTVRFDCGTRLAECRKTTDPAVLARLRPEARGKIWQCDLKRAGVSDPGRMMERGFSPHVADREIPTAEFYCGGKRMELSRYPKTGFLEPKRLVQPGVIGGETSVLEYDSPCHERWVNAEDLWLFGYFRYRWADARIKVAEIDTEKHHIIMDHAYSYANLGTMDTAQGIAYYAFNLLEELSEPGEWYLDRRNMILYFRPPNGCDPRTAELELNLLNGAPVVMNHVRFLVLEGFHFDLGRSCVIRMTDCSDCVIDGCALTRFGATGIMAKNVRNCTVRNCELAWLGRGGIDMTGGDRETLTPSGNVIENNRIHDFGCIDHTYTPAIRADGVGFRMAHNLLYHAPSSVLRLEGNDHIFEYNEVHSAVRESDDQGAVDIFQNPTYRGNVFRYNYFHDIGRKPSDSGFLLCGAAGIRLDDVISGTVICSNIFVRSAGRRFGAVQINCGRDNLIENNLFLDLASALSGGFGARHHEYGDIAGGKPKFSGCYMTDLYFERYPALKNFLDGNGKNTFRRNIISGCRTIKYNLLPDDPAPGYEMQDNLFIRKLNQTIAEAMAEGVEAIGFRPIPVDEIGLKPCGGCAWLTYGEPSVPAERLPSWEKEDAPDYYPVIHGSGRILPEWRAFGPFPRESRMPTRGETVRCPESVGLNGVRCPARPAPARDGIFDLAEFSAEKKEHEIYWIYAELVCEKDGLISIGAGFDYWGHVWLDGDEVFSTGREGNVFSTAHAENHIFTVRAEAGRHLLAVRLESGSNARADLALDCAESLSRRIGRRWWWTDPVYEE